MSGVFKLRIVLSGVLDSEETVYRFSVLQGMGALYSEISAVYVKEAGLEEFLLENKSRVLSFSDIKERAKYLPVFPEKVKSKTDSSCIKSGKSQLVSCVKEDGVYRVGFFNKRGEFLSDYGDAVLSRLLGEVFCGKAILLKSELIDSSVYEMLSGMSDKMREVLNDLSRGKLTGGDLSESSINGIFGDSPTVKSEGLKGVGNGVNIYSKYASSVSVEASEIQATGTAILDMSKCSLLSEFSLYDECDDDDLPETSLDRLTLIFPSGVGNLRGDSFTVTAEELCIQNLEVLGSFEYVSLYGAELSGVTAISAENIVIGGCSGIDKLTISTPWYSKNLGDITLYNLPTLSELTVNRFQVAVNAKTVLIIEECPKLRKVYLRCVATNLSCALDLARFGGDTEEGGRLFSQADTSIRELSVECSSFSCSEGMVDITKEFPDLEKLCLTGNLEITQSDFVLVVPRGCKVDCSDRRLRSKGSVETGIILFYEGAEMKHKFDKLAEAWYAVALTGYYCESGDIASHYVFTVLKVYGSFSEHDKTDVEGFSILERIFVKKDRLKGFLTSGHGSILGAVTEHSTPVSVAGINYVDKLAEYSKDGTIIKSGSMIQVLMIKKSGAVVYLNELGEVAETRDEEYLVDCLLNSRVVALYCRSGRPLEFENRVESVFNRILSSYSDYVLRNARDSFLRSDCSKTDVRIGSGLVLEVTAPGLSGNGCGVNKYGDWVSTVIVDADDLYDTNNSVLDMEDCVHLSRFNLDCGSANAFPHLSIIFPKGISKLSVDRFWINTGKLRLLNLPKNISYGDVSITGARIEGHTGEFTTNTLSLSGTSGLSDVSLHQLMRDRDVDIEISGCSDLRRVSLYFDVDERDARYFSLKIARCVELEELLIEINKQEPLEIAFFCGTHLLSMTGTPKLSSLTIRCEAGFNFSPIEGWEFLDFSRCFPRLREFRLIGEFSSESAGGKIIVPRGCKVSGWERDIGEA